MLSLLVPATGTHFLRSRAPEGLLQKEVIFDICNENDSSKTTRKNNNNTRMRRCDTEPRCNVAGQWLKKKGALLSLACPALFASDVVRTCLLAFEQLSPTVWDTWMILTRKRLLVDIFLTRRLSKSLAFYKFASVNFEPCEWRRGV